MLMACLDMYNSEHKGHCSAPMSPRLSFSIDFVNAQESITQERCTREAPVSSNFEFSVTNYSMMSADELFFKGRLLPFKDSCNSQGHRATTLRQELLAASDDDDSKFSLRPPKGTTRLKGLLGLRRIHIGSKKTDMKNMDGFVVEGRRRGVVNEGAHGNITSQEIFKEGDSRCGDVEIGI